MIILGTRIGRLRVIFTLPKNLKGPGSLIPIPVQWPKTPLAYIEWYTRQGRVADKNHGMYSIIRAYDSKGRSQGTIIPLSDIRQSCMLCPVTPRNLEEAKEAEKWEYDSVLDDAKTFLINNWVSKYAYQTLY